MHLIFQVTGAAPLLHDATLLYAFIADGILRLGKDPRDGAEFLRYAPRVQFDGEYTHVQYIMCPKMCILVSLLDWWRDFLAGNVIYVIILFRTVSGEISSLGHIFYSLQYMGCMCSINPLKFKWSSWYICKSSYYHHEFGSINLSHCCYYFCGCESEVAVPSYFVSCCIQIPR